MTTVVPSDCVVNIINETPLWLEFIKISVPVLLSSAIAYFAASKGWRQARMNIVADNSFARKSDAYSIVCELVYKQLSRVNYYLDPEDYFCNPDAEIAYIQKHHISLISEVVKRNLWISEEISGILTSIPVSEDVGRFPLEHHQVVRLQQIYSEAVARMKSELQII
ncbi:MAG: hypothetical protein KBC57_03380 [Neisseriaceae bacterium]|nr:hypothetical protein [Neisseriaceae bacterium]